MYGGSGPGGIITYVSKLRRQSRSVRSLCQPAASTNIADTRYVASCYSTSGCFSADIRKVVARLSYRW